MTQLSDTFAERYAQNRAMGQDQVSAFAAAHPANSRQASFPEIPERESFAERAADLEARPEVAARIAHLETQLETARIRLAELVAENNSFDVPTWQNAHARQWRLYEPKRDIHDILWYADA